MNSQNLLASNNEPIVINDIEDIEPAQQSTVPSISKRQIQKTESLYQKQQRLIKRLRNQVKTQQKSLEEFK